MVTEGLVMASQKAVDDRGEDSIKDKLSNIQSFVQDTFDEDVNNSDDDYELLFQADTALDFVLDMEQQVNESDNIDSIDTYEDAATICQEAFLDQYGKWTWAYDVRMVFDTRSLDAHGAAESGGVGDDKEGTGWVNDKSPKKTTAHELGHLFGVGTNTLPSRDHTTFQNRWTRHTLMGKSMNDDCDGDTNAISLKSSSFADCSVEVMRDYWHW